MSSHHIVRDEQEPALLLLEPEAVPFEIIGQLLEWSPIVITTDLALQQVLDLQIKVDVVFYVDSDKKLLETKLAEQFPVQLIQQTTAQSLEQDLKQYLNARNQKAINLVASPTLAQQFQQSMIKDLALVTFSGSTKSYFIKTGIFEKWAAKGQKFSIGSSTKVKSASNLSDINSSEKAFEVLNDGFVRLEMEAPGWISEIVI